MSTFTLFWKRLSLEKRQLGHRKNYLDPIRKAFDKQFEDLDHYKQEDAFKRCLRNLTMEDVKAVIRRADAITLKNESDGRTLIKYKDYSYYRDNPALTIHLAVKTILQECGIINAM